MYTASMRRPLPQGALHAGTSGIQQHRGICGAVFPVTIADTGTVLAVSDTVTVDAGA